MGSIIGKGKRRKMFRRVLPRGFDQSFGGMATVMGYLPLIEQLELQGLDKWWYVIGVSRVLWLFDLPKMTFIVD